MKNEVLDDWVRKAEGDYRTAKREHIVREDANYDAVLNKEDDIYITECPEVGTVSQGNTLEEALTNLQEATELFLEEFPNHKLQSLSSKETRD